MQCVFVSVNKIWLVLLQAPTRFVHKQKKIFYMFIYISQNNQIQPTETKYNWELHRKEYIATTSQLGYIRLKKLALCSQ